MFIKILSLVLAVSTFCLVGCSSYSDYADAYSNHQLNDRERISKTSSELRSIYMETINKMYSSPDYLVEMTMYDAKGNPVPLRIKDTARDTNIMMLTMQMTRDLASVGQATPFNLKAPTTMEDVFMRGWDFVPYLAMFGIVDTLVKNAGPQYNMAADNGSLINSGPGTITSSPIEAADSFNPSTIGEASPIN